MAVGEDQPDGVIAGRLDAGDGDAPFARDQLTLARPMALDFRARAFDAQILRRQAERGAVLEFEFEQVFRAAEFYFGGGAHGSMLRASSTSMIGMPLRMG